MSGLCIGGLVGDCGTKTNTKLTNYFESKINQTQMNTIYNNCEGVQSNKNVVDLGNLGAGCKININQTNKAKFLCSITNLIKAGVQSDAPIDIKNELAEHLKTQGFGTQTQSTTTVENMAKKYLSQTNIQDIKNSCLLKIVADNIVKVGDCVGAELNVNQTNDAYNSCVYDSIIEGAKQAGAPLNFGQSVDKGVDASGISLASLLGFGGMEYLMIVVIIGGVVGAYFFMNGGGSSIQMYLIIGLVVLVFGVIVYYKYFKQDDKKK